jgi:hypothetical protein
MKKMAAVFALNLLALMTMNNSFGQDVVVIRDEATRQIRAAQQKINENMDLVNQVADLAKKLDRDGIRKIFIANGAPSYTTIGTLILSPYNPNRIEINCTFEYAPAALSCTVGW